MDVQFGNQVEVINKIAEGIRGGKYVNGVKADKLVLVGHSLGSIFSLGTLDKYPDIADGIYSLIHQLL
jgi:hypothetical protein